jgi:hypothetical protein
MPDSFVLASLLWSKGQEPGGRVALQGLDAGALRPSKGRARTPSLCSLWLAPARSAWSGRPFGPRRPHQAQHEAHSDFWALGLIVTNTRHDARRGWRPGPLGEPYPRIEQVGLLLQAWHDRRRGTRHRQRPLWCRQGGLNVERRDHLIRPCTKGMRFSARMSGQHFPYLLLHPYSHGAVSLSSAGVRRHSISQACQEQ